MVERIAIALRVGDADIKKAWRYHSDHISKYTRKEVENKIIELFPDFDRKGLKLEMWYQDELIGDVSSAPINCKPPYSGIYNSTLNVIRDNVFELVSNVIGVIHHSVLIHYTIS